MGFSHMVVDYTISMRKVVIVGPPPVQVLDVTGPLEVFSNAPGYEIQIASPGPETVLRTNRGFGIEGTIPNAGRCRRPRSRERSFRS